MQTIPNVSLVAEQGSRTPYLILGDSRFRLNLEDFGALGMRGDRVRVVEAGTLAAFTDKPIKAAPTVRPSDVFFDCPARQDTIFRQWFVNCQSSRSLVQREVLVAGWLFMTTPTSPASPYVNAAANGVEDVFYDVKLDPVFLHRMYGPGGLSLRMDGATYGGNPPDATPLPFAAGPPSPVDGLPANTYNSWFLPGSNNDLHGELNSWHTQDTGGLFRVGIVGRGPAPAGWTAPLAVDADAWFPFNPLNPDDGPRNLRVGDYVLMRGPLWEDHWHGDPNAVLDPWDTGPTRHHAWLEMHPIDWVVRIREPQPNAHVSGARALALAADGPAQVALPIFPGFDPGRGRRLVVRAVEQDDDRRAAFVAGTVTGRQTTNAGDHIDASLTVNPETGRPGRWKGSWLVSWSEVDDSDRIWVDDAMPPGAVPGGDEAWTWTADPRPYYGTQAHQSTLAVGIHQHYFTVDPAAGFTVGPGDLLVAATFLDPANPPDEVMLQWATTNGGWEHRAFWGADLIRWGTPGTASRRSLGRLPFSGEWVRLDVPAAAVGLENSTVIGMAFTLAGGRATWDYAGRREALPSSGRLTATVSPVSVRVGTRTVRVRATDSGSGATVAGRVLLEGQDLAATEQPFTREYLEPAPVLFDVRAPGYPPARARLTVIDDP
jgi:hypothetical protein